MSRSRSVVLVALIAVAAACSGGADDAAPDATTATTAATTVTASATTTTLGLPETSSTECEDVPDPADYPPTVRPRAYRPCTPPAQLAVHTIRTGTGRRAEVGDTLIVDYTGVRSADGTLFDTSYLRGLPLDFELGRGNVVAGWEQGLAGATAGSLIKLDVPPELAYGDTPPDDAIQPGDALTFMIEVRAVIAPVTPDEAPLDLLVEPSIGIEELVVTDVVVGDGATVEPGDTAVVNMLLVRGDNLVVMLNTWQREDPLQVIIEESDTLPGIVSGLQGAKVGGTRVLTVPPDLAFGAQGEPGLGLPPDTDLIVVVQVVGVY
jgi:peptidylprolyl isomerase